MELGGFGDNFPSSHLDDLMKNEKMVFLPGKTDTYGERLTTLRWS